MKKKAIIAVGGYGTNFLKHGAKKQREEFSYYLIDDAKNIDPELDAKTYLIPDIHATFDTNEEVKVLFDELKDYQNVYVVAGGGGNTGNFVVAKIAEELKKHSVNLKVLFTKPFAYEGKDRVRAANELEVILKNQNISYISIENDGLREQLKQSKEKIGLSQLLQIVDHQFQEIIYQK